MGLREYYNVVVALLPNNYMKSFFKTKWNTMCVSTYI